MKKIPVCETSLWGNEAEYVKDAVYTGWISGSGEYVTRFEKRFAEYCGCRHGISVTNGTVALHLALRALQIGKGDEIIIPAFTMIATAFAVCYTGAMPVFVDADPETWNINIEKIEKKITSRTKAIIPVHIFGNPCNMDEIKHIAEKHGLFIVEDAAEAHGAMYGQKTVGSFSDIAAFSFFANKNITTGEGGMCVTDSPEYDRACKYYRNMCFPVDGPRDYLHEEIGFNYRMSNLHAAVGLAQVEKADQYKDARIRNNKLYKKYLAGCDGIRFQKDEPNSINVHWMNAVLVEAAYGHSKDELEGELYRNGVETRSLFQSMARQKSLQRYGCNSCVEEYEVTDYLAKNGFYLPSSSNLTENDIKYICEIINGYAR